MKSTKNISLLQAMFILIMAVGFSNHVIIIPLLLQVGLRDSWISVLFTYLLFNVWLLLPYYITSRTGQQSLFDWLKDHYNRWVANLIIWSLGIYLLFIAALTIKETVSWVNITYLTLTPRVVIAASFILLCLFIAGSGIRSIAITTGILLPFVWIFGYFVMSANFQYKDYSRLFPVFTQGVEPIMQAMVYAGGGFVEVFILLLFQHKVSKSVHLKAWLLLAFILVGLTLGPLMGSMATYGPVESANQRYPAFEQWRLVSVGKYVAHVDFLALYQWLSGAFIRISLALYIILDLVKPKSRLNKRVFLSLFFVFLLSAALAPVSDMTYLRWIQQVYYPASLSFILVFSCLLASLVFVKSHLRRREQP
ncbi:endospore germination permease [Paenibacillus sp. J2TS4]|uniref:endospore germination permease n=1 Tax=Paenibacillus sp. J2TS4 TaxID=2807194 RepID=UPI001B298A9C|nr:endospore germination permease [Paenibacillus sp. J2TS4]GIP33226.1 hypothetical protein J2TS4_24360 [Paenibacillus sp. J2TS4]